MSKGSGENNETHEVEATETPDDSQSLPLEQLEDEAPQDSSGKEVGEIPIAVEDDEILPIAGDSSIDFASITVEQEADPDGSSMMEAAVGAIVTESAIGAVATEPSPDSKPSKTKKDGKKNKKEKGKEKPPKAKKADTPKGKQIGNTGFYSQSGGKYIVGPNDDNAAYRAACSKEGPWHDINLSVVGWHKRVIAGRTERARFALGFQEQLPILTPAAAKRKERRMLKRHKKRVLAQQAKAASPKKEQKPKPKKEKKKSKK